MKTHSKVGLITNSSTTIFCYKEHIHVPLAYIIQVNCFLGDGFCNGGGSYSRAAAKQHIVGYANSSPFPNRWHSPASKRLNSLFVSHSLTVDSRDRNWKKNLFYKFNLSSYEKTLNQHPVNSNEYNLSRYNLIHAVRKFHKKHRDKLNIARINNLPTVHFHRWRGFFTADLKDTRWKMSDSYLEVSLSDFYETYSSIKESRKVVGNDNI